MGSGPNGCFTPRTYQHVNLGVAGIVLAMYVAKKGRGTTAVSTVKHKITRGYPFSTTLRSAVHI